MSVTPVLGAETPVAPDVLAKIRKSGRAYMHEIRAMATELEERRAKDQAPVHTIDFNPFNFFQP